MGSGQQGRQGTRASPSAPGANNTASASKSLPSSLPWRLSFSGGRFRSVKTFAHSCKARVSMENNSLPCAGTEQHAHDAVSRVVAIGW